MQSTARKLQNPQTLTAIPGYLNDKEKIQKATDNAWIIAFTVLWNGEIFSTEEKAKAKQYIRYWIINQPCIRHAYLQAAQRILLANQYIAAAKGRYVPSPSEWFDPANQYGFAGTEEWFNKMQKKRIAMPLYNQHLKAFAEAVEEMADEPTARNFHYWREYFIERNCQALLNIFLATVTNMSYTLR